MECDARAVLQDLVVMVLDVMGVPASAAEPRSTLADMGIDSMQQARAHRARTRVKGYMSWLG